VSGKGGLQGGQAVPVGSVWIGAAREQDFNSLRLSALRRKHQGSSPIGVARVNIRIGAEQRLQRGEVANFGGVSEVRVGAAQIGVGPAHVGIRGSGAGTGGSVQRAGSRHLPLSLRRLSLRRAIARLGIVIRNMRCNVCFGPSRQRLGSCARCGS
jgi:hypothetical protein